MYRTIGILGMTLLLQACTIQYKPAIYPIKEGRIPGFPVSGEVTVENLQLDASETSFFDGNGSVLGNYQAVSELMASQLQSEIEANGLVNDSGAIKNLEVKVVKLWSKPKAFHFNSGLTAEITLGNGEQVRVEISHGSPSGIAKVLNGSIALAVIETLKNPTVLSYLAE